MSRVNITVPDDIVAQAKAAGLNLSRIATAGLVDELDRRNKISALDAYLADLERELGPISPAEHAAAAGWVDRLITPQSAKPAATRRGA